MFYSAELLTSRKYGVATVWLVATLGSKSTLKKVSRKAILDVDVQQACQTIVAPDAPMALRLQSNLLHGLARVYSQQCSYILTDAENARNNIRMILKEMHASDLNLEGTHKARADQLVLPDDPRFLPDFDLMPIDLDLIDFDGTTAHNSQRSTLSPHSSQGTASSGQYMNDLMIPPSVSSFIGGPVGGGLKGFKVRGDSGPGSRLEPAGFLDDDLGIHIEADGTVHIDDEYMRDPSVPLRRPSVASPGSAASRIRGDHAVGQVEDDTLLQEDDGFLPIYDDDVHQGSEGLTIPQAIPDRDTSEGQPFHQSTTSETAIAPLRSRRTVASKIVPVDNIMELRNGDLARWSMDYITNMNEGIRLSETRKSAALAKKNAEHFVLGALLGQYDIDENGPLSMFFGRNIMKTLGGVDTKSVGKKRMHSNEDEAENGRRVRSRSHTPVNENPLAMDDDGYVAPFDDTVEQGRDAPTPLDDRHHSSAFPWNQSTDSRRPAHIPSGYFAGVPTSGSIGGAPLGSYSRRGSRLVSASPLHGRGTAIAGDQMNLDLEDHPLLFGSQDDGFTGIDEFELFGPAANVDTQTAAHSQWQKAILDSESHNFLDFVKAGIEQAKEVDEDVDAVEFETLLPPESNTCVVAAQALLHVLTLGTRNLLHITQDEAFGSPISMQLVDVE